MDENRASTSMLQASAYLLGILLWKIQRREGVEGSSEVVYKLEKAQREVEELKRRRTEDAKANQKVVSIFATQEQSWLSEKRKLKQQISNLKLNEEEAEVKRRDVEEKLQRVEAAVVVELRESKEKHASELWKHKTAFMELVSNQRQLEAEMARALRQVEATKQDLDLANKRKEESLLMVQQLSMDSEQKDKILSAMLRKSKLDTAERDVLLQELKMSNEKKKQVELEMKRHSMLYERNSSRGNLFSGNSQKQRTANRNNPRNRHLDCMQVEHKKEESQLITVDVKQLEGWIRGETQKNTAMLEQRHRMEIDAFSEQLRLKDDKLEAFRWQLLSTDLESKQLHSHAEGLEKENMKLEAELKANNSSLNMAIWSDVKIIKTKPSEDVQPMCSVETNLIVEPHEEEIEVEKEVVMDTGHTGLQYTSAGESELVNKFESNEHSLINKVDSIWKIDIHSMGVSYNIKRLKQQLLLLENLAGVSRSCKTKEFKDNSHFWTKGFAVLMSQLKKQVSRYQSLQEKIDELCKRMHENDLDNCGGGGSRIAMTRKETKTLEIFLEETLQLQRYMVATGQKLMELQSRIASGFISSAEEANRSSSFDMKRFAESVRTIFKDVQKGLDVRIARLIGDLEGTLTCDGIMHS